jgi:di/tricarboxylate transporter
MPPVPEPHALAVLLLTVFALILFSRSTIPLETSALLVLVLLVVGFQLFPFVGAAGALQPIDLFQGFGHPALIAVSALMVAGHGLVRTGALEVVGRVLAKVWQQSPQLSMLATLVCAALLSAFVNNTPIVILLLPVLVSVAVRNGVSPSPFLIPMNYATLVGGMGTTIGTSTNLLVVGIAADMGLPFGMFDFTLPAVLVGSVCILYLWLVAPRILPERGTALGDISPRIFSAHLFIPEESFGDGKRLAELIKKTDGRMKVMRIRRSEEASIFPLPDARVLAADKLMVHDTAQNLKEFEQLLEARLFSGETEVDEDHPLKAEHQQLAEVVIHPTSILRGRSLSEVRFADRYNAIILALHRDGRAIKEMPQGVQNVRLKMGDVLLIQGSAEDIERLKQGGDHMVLDAKMDLPRTSRAPVALGIMFGIVALAAFDIMPVTISAPLGVLCMLLFRCLNWRDIGQALSAQVILIIVSSLALGKALLLTGGSDWLAHAFVALTAGAAPAVLLGGLILLMAVLTNVVSNNAAAVIGTPIAFGIAQTLGLPAEPFILAVLFGANMSFVTPMAYQTNLLVMSAGGYSFGDFVRAGLPLALIAWLGFTLMLSLIYRL